VLPALSLIRIIRQETGFAVRCRMSEFGHFRGYSIRWAVSAAIS
jgi:hypothetical protein